jgi:hypothetical protein
VEKPFHYRLNQLPQYFGVVCKSLVFSWPSLAGKLLAGLWACLQPGGVDTFTVIAVRET